MIRKETRSFELLKRTLQEACENDTVIAVLPVPSKKIVRGYRIMITNCGNSINENLDRSWSLTKEEMCVLRDILLNLEL